MLDLQGSSGIAWVTAHKLTSLLTLVLLGVKLTLHWKWIANAFKHHVLRMGHAKPSGSQRRSADVSLRQSG